MTKYLFLAAAMTVAAPVAAQSSQVPPQGAQQSGEIAAGADQLPATSSPTTAPQSSSQPADPMAPADSSVPAPTTDSQAAPVPGQPAPGQPAPSQPAADPDTAATAGAGGTQVAQVVGQEFGAYDKDGDGKLSQAEFAGWMVALKTASDPATKADSPATRKWVGAAFAQADKDKSRSLTQAELTGFLSQGQS